MQIDKTFFLSCTLFSQNARVFVFVIPIINKIATNCKALCTLSCKQIVKSDLSLMSSAALYGSKASLPPHSQRVHREAIDARD